MSNRSNNRSDGIDAVAKAMLKLVKGGRDPEPDLLHTVANS
jgi:hypothetical protein